MLSEEVVASSLDVAIFPVVWNTKMYEGDTYTQQMEVIFVLSTLKCASVVYYEPPNPADSWDCAHARALLGPNVANE